MIATHIDLDRLHAFDQGRLHFKEYDEIEQHLTECATCCDLLNENTSSDRLLALIKDAASSGNTAVSTVPDTLVGLAPVAPIISATDPPTDFRPDLPASLANHPRYHLLEQLGKGGMGVVYLAEHRHMQRRVALKVINPRLLEQPSAVERFRREVQAASRLEHPNIVRAYDSENMGDCHFLVMEFVEGVSLDRYIKENGKLSVAQACQLARQVAIGLQHAHDKGMVHRDIKPHNLMLTEGGVVKILDFGLARFANQHEEAVPLTDEQVGMGTPDYMAPEQALDARTADIRADIYSLGCTLYHFLAGHPPFPGGTSTQKIMAHIHEPTPTIASKREDIPHGLQTVLTRMLAKDAASRFQTPQEVVDALATPTRDRGESATVVTKTMPVPGQRPRRSWRGWGILAATLLLAGVGTWFGPAIYRIVTDQGQVTIESSSPDVEVIVKKNGKQIDILHPKFKRTLTLKADRYEVALDGKVEGLALESTDFTITANGKAIVRVTIEKRLGAGPPVKEKNEKVANPIVPPPLKEKHEKVAKPIVPTPLPKQPVQDSAPFSIAQIRRADFVLVNQESGSALKAESTNAFVVTNPGQATKWMLFPQGDNHFAFRVTGGGALLNTLWLDFDRNGVPDLGRILDMGAVWHKIDVKDGSFYLQATAFTPISAGYYLGLIDGQLRLSPERHAGALWNFQAFARPDAIPLKKPPIDKALTPFVGNQAALAQREFLVVNPLTGRALKVERGERIVLTAPEEGSRWSFALEKNDWFRVSSDRSHYLAFNPHWGKIVVETNPKDANVWRKVNGMDGRFALQVISSVRRRFDDFFLSVIDPDWDEVYLSRVSTPASEWILVVAPE